MKPEEIWQNMITRGGVEQTGIVAIIDQNGVYQYVSKDWEDTTGISREHALGHSVSDILEGSGAAAAMKNARSLSGVMHYRVRGGGTFSAFTKYRPLKDRNGTVYGCIAEVLFDNVNEALSFASDLGKMKGRNNAMKENGAGNRSRYTIDDIIGRSKSIQTLKQQITLAAGTGASCLIEGETGTGKELVAHSIHNLSRRNALPFVRVNCSAIPQTLMESEFFGYEEGSFTGGVKGGRKGKFETANQGSMFLDEINAMDLTMQPKLLRALQEHEIERIGGSTVIPVDVRIIAASNRPLEELVREGSFREDLYYRLDVIHIRLAPLRERKEDIRLLSDLFIERYNEELGRSIYGMTDDAEEFLLKQDWPGNIRQLQNSIARAMVACRGELLTREDFQMFHRDLETEGTGKMAAEQTGVNPVRLMREETAVNTGDSLQDIKRTTEKRTIEQILEECGGNKSKAAERLGISRTMLYKKLKMYGLTEKMK